MAKKETQRQTDLLTDLGDNMVKLREHTAEVAAMHEDLQRDVASANAEFQSADKVVRSARQTVEMLDQTKHEVAGHLKQLQTALEEQRASSMPYRQHEQQQQSLHAETLRELDEADRALTKLEANLEAFDTGRAEAEVAEQELLVNELELREQLHQTSGEYLRPKRKNK